MTNPNEHKTQHKLDAHTLHYEIPTFFYLRGTGQAWQTLDAELPKMDAWANREGRHPMGSSQILRILAEFGQIAIAAAMRPQGQVLDVYIQPPYFYVHVKKAAEGDTDRVLLLLDPPEPDQCIRITISSNIYDWDNIHARQLGWYVNAGMMLIAEGKQPPQTAFFFGYEHLSLQTVREVIAALGWQLFCGTQHTLPEWTKTEGDGMAISTFFGAIRERGDERAIQWLLDVAEQPPSATQGLHSFSRLAFKEFYEAYRSVLEGSALDIDIDDAAFLLEIRNHVEQGFHGKDPTLINYALKLIDDWIDELQGDNNGI